MEITNIDTGLSHLLSCDNVSIEQLDSLVEGIKDNMNRKEILSKHKPIIKQLPNGRYYTRINGRKIERSDKKDLEDLIVDAYRLNNITIMSICDDYINHRKQIVGDTTWRKDKVNFDIYIKGSPIADIPLSDLTLMHGYKFVDHVLSVKPDMKERYWKNIKSLMNQIFRYAIDSGLLNDNPFVNLRPRKDMFNDNAYTRDGDTVFTEAERNIVCKLAEEDASIQGQSEPLGIIILFNLGIRIGELCPLRWSDIESDTRGVYVHIQREVVPNIRDDGTAHGYMILNHTKTPAGNRRLLLNRKIRKILNHVKEYNRLNDLPVNDNDFIFLRKSKDISFCTPQCFEWRLKKYCKKADMTVSKSPHDIRRTVLTNLYMLGMPLKKIQEFAGHSSLKQTMDYIRVTDDDLDMMQYLDKLS